jgi:hypothetical protein
MTAGPTRPATEHVPHAHPHAPARVATPIMKTIIPPAPAVQLPPERFRSTEPWNEQRVRALAMYCSDGRWGDAFDDFCHRSLQIPRYDRFAVPGGPAWLTVHHEHQSAGAGDPASHTDNKAVLLEASLSRSAWEQLALLVQVHELQRIVLVAHYGCAFYTERLKRDADACLPRQMEDLAKAREAVRKRFPRLTVETYVAMRKGERLSFHGQV